jgi:hypothetical protein
MQGNNLFEYAVIRVVPKVEREEFVNVGVILYCQKQHFLRTLYKIDAQKLAAFDCEPDCIEIEENLNSFVRICEGGDNSGPIGKLILSERFRWLTAVRSTVVQTSRVHPGFCVDAQETLERLFNQLVL